MFSTVLIRWLVKTQDRGFLDNLRWALLLRIRGVWVAFHDPAAEFEFGNSYLRLNLSHDLPLIRRSYPLYSDNLGRIARYISEKYELLSVIDIGANIGDSAAVIHQHVRVPILCVEGEPKYLNHLRHNVSKMAPLPVIEESFIAAEEANLSVVVSAGTARLAPVTADGASKISTRSFEKLLAAHPNFAGAKLLKLDTDGMDVVILNSAYEWIVRQKPAIFFEYDPAFQSLHGDGGLLLLNRLSQSGYETAFVYDNTGDFMFSAPLSDGGFWRQFHEYLCGRASKKYVDLCVFHAEDRDVADEARPRELEVFRSARRYKSPIAIVKKEANRHSGCN
jgi:FkbM family methyltransferase